MEPSGQPRQVAVKHKMHCCITTANNQMNNKTKPTIPCDFCHCKFYQYKMRNSHMLVHQCKHCDESCVALDNDGLPHSFRYKQEAQLGKLQIQRQREMDDDFVLSYVKANRLNEYRPRLDYDPNFGNILFKYRFEKEEWVPFIKKFKRRLLRLFFGVFKTGQSYDDQRKRQHLTEQLNAQTIPYLLEHGAMSVHDATDFLKIVSISRKYDDYVEAIVSYFLDKDYEIKAEWVANAINNDKLIERIKSKHTFTFGEIHKARAWQSFSPFDVKALRTFYTQIQKHFFNPDFENPFDGWVEDENQREHDQNPKHFIYNKENDELVMIADNGMYQEMDSLGSCAEIMGKSLKDLIIEYMAAIDEYDELDEELDDMRERHDDYWQNIRWQKKKYRGGYDDYGDYPDKYEIGEKEEERDEQALEVSKLYFVISIK